MIIRRCPCALPLAGLLMLVSYVDRVYQEIGKFLSREFQDNIDVFEQKIEPKLKVGRIRAALSMAVLAQLTMAAIAMLIGYLLFSDPAWSVYEVLQATISADVDRHLVQPLSAVRLLLAHQRRVADSLDYCALTGLDLLVMPVTIVLGFLQSVASLTKRTRPNSRKPRPRRWTLDRSWPGRGHYSGGRPRPDPVRGGIQRQDRARSDEAASRDVCGSVRHDGRTLYRDAAGQALLARARV